MIQPKSSRLLSFSVEAARLSDADAAPKAAPAPAPRPKSLTRRESPLAAAARRAREAMARKAAPRAREGPVKVDGPIKARESPVTREGPKAKDSPVKARGKELPVKAKETKEGPKAKAVPKPAARTTPYAARSLIERPKVESKVLEKKLGKSETSETSAGSTPKCVLFEDTSKMTDRVDRAEILEAAQVLRKEAQDLGQALRQWVAEAEAEAEDAKEATSSVAISEATRRSNDQDEASEVHLVLDGAEARPNSPVLPDPTLEVHGRQRLEHECERLDADLQRVAGEWHRLWSERQRAIEALTDTDRSRVSAPPAPPAPPAPLPLPARATLGTLPGNTVAQAPCPARATVPALNQARSVARTPSPIARMPLEPGAGYPPASPVLSPFARGASPMVSFRYTTGSPVSPFAGSSPLQVQRRTLSPVTIPSPVRSVSPYRVVQMRQMRPVSPQLVPRAASPMAFQAPVGSQFLVPRGVLQVGNLAGQRRADGDISHL